MEAKDTIAPACRLCSSASNQAEISFAAGEAQGIQKGRREVVEWIQKRQCYNDIGGVISIDFMPGEWQAFLKSKGLEE